jgi:GT2 family glycosyltransferase
MAPMNCEQTSGCAVVSDTVDVTPADAPTVLPGPPWAKPTSVEISVVIPTYQRRESARRTVERLLQDRRTPLEVVVVDDGSTDGTWHMLDAIAARDPRLVALRQPNGGKQSATRRAVQAARGRVLLFLDDDVLPEPGLVAGHLAAHAQQEDLVVVGYMPTTVPLPATGRAFATVLYAREYEGRCEAYERDPDDILQHLWMGNVSISRSAYDRALAVDRTGFPHRHEDRDIGLLCAESGLRGRFDRSLRASHQHSRTVEQFVKDCRQQGAGMVELERRHPETAVFDLDDISSGLPTAAAAVVRASRRESVRRLASGALVTALRLSTHVSDPRPALTLARVLRKLEHQRGAMTAQQATPEAPARV